MTHPHIWMREHKCTEESLESDCGTCPQSGQDVDVIKCDVDTVAIYRPRDCAAEERYDELRLLRDEVIKPEFYGATSARFLDPSQFHLEKVRCEPILLLLLP